MYTGILDQFAGAGVVCFCDFNAGFANEGQFLLMNQASLDDLNQRMTSSAQHAEHALHSRRHATSMTAGTLSRFRPNLLVGGPSMAPYAEDSWQELQIGGNTFHAAGDICTVSTEVLVVCE